MRRLALATVAGGAGVLLARSPHYVPYADLTADLDEAIGGERHTFSWGLGAVSYRVRGAGTPVVLVHGINAAASAYEMRRPFAFLGEGFRVYAPDLLGFGLSDRPRHRYSADTYVALLGDFLREVVGAPAHLIASSVSAAHAVRLANEQPQAIRTLVLICPTGIERLAGPPTAGQRLAETLIGLPVLGPRLFAALVSRPSIRIFLRTMSYHQAQKVTRETVEVYHRSGQRPGGLWAPRAFLGGRFNQDIRDLLTRVEQPILLAWGKEAGTVPLDLAPAFLERNPRATLKVFAGASLLPHDEQADVFNLFVDGWLKEQEA